MFHLIKDNVSTIENNLLGAKYFTESLFSWWFNIFLLVTILGSFGYFLWAGYDTQPPQELKKIPFEPRTWNNAVKNVPLVDYGQTPQIEVRDGIQGHAFRSSSAAF
jgi:hypothetical protein